ncbi:uncharacterized protein Z520_01324 [Fonsecaea multimorphosa CBS 102226]|uniref:Translation initiation factor IF2/IF5 domain-containing protein n=1 Tax=Fonsecaea multimorphosa CBS 102226 TaxID=1442371 RepID=A0A0D2L1E0_9EURO|nr:uncharacterized protein Z520_01324 [Fonsecaea multimorphosa CBS 102226]KIY02859.1 hypothetical protein Z520_01324 [Fonsecaea multimorphosa CBS 102226]
MAEVVRNATQIPTSHADASSVGEPNLKPHAPRPTSRKNSDNMTTTDTPSPPLQEQQPQPIPHRKPRKSVAFSGDSTIMDENGEISEAPLSGAEDKVTAEKHSSPPDDQAVDEMTDMFAGLNKKKKKSTKTKTEDKEDGEAAAAAAPGTGADGDFDASALKKKKKKTTKPKTEGEDFAEKLARAGLAADATTDEKEEAAGQEQAGDMTQGTGIWAHDATSPISYELLLTRFFHLVNEHNPDILSSGSKSYKIPPPQCLREGNKKTIFANIAEICKRMNRNDEHVTQFLFAELGTSGSVDGSKRLVIKGRFQQKQIENVLRRYIVEYVTCKTCRSPNTELSKGENRLYFVTCKSCGSRRSVTAIKSGFTAQVGKRKRLNG